MLRRQWRSPHQSAAAAATTFAVAAAAASAAAPAAAPVPGSPVGLVVAVEVCWVCVAFAHHLLVREVSRPPYLLLTTYWCLPECNY